VRENGVDRVDWRWEYVEIEMWRNLEKTDHFQYKDKVKTLKETNFPTEKTRTCKLLGHFYLSKNWKNKNLVTVAIRQLETW
jgi:hypothetical protein